MKNSAVVTHNNVNHNAGIIVHTKHSVYNSRGIDTRVNILPNPSSALLSADGMASHLDASDGCDTSVSHFTIKTAVSMLS